MSFKNADVWIQTGVLWCRKRHLFQLPHNQLHVAVVGSATAVVIIAAVVADPVVIVIIALAVGVVIIAVTAVVGVAATVINCCCYHVVLVVVNYPPLTLESSVLPIRNYFEKQRCKKLKQ